MSTAPDASAHIDPQALLAIRDLELRVRVVMEGVRVGLHRSPSTGFSVEFSEYRQYVPGEDLRHLDWKVAGRTDRYYVRKYEEETNLRCWILLDASRSMLFGSRGGVSKSDYARTFAASLARFLHDQRDGVGTALFDEHVHDVVAPRWRPGHVRHILATLSRPPDGRATDLSRALNEAARLAQRRALIVLISDFLTPPQSWSAALSELAAAGHELRALQILDPAELGLDDFGQAAQWEDLETGETRYIDPERARESYRRRLAEHNEEVRRVFERAEVRHQFVLTSQPLDHALLQFLRQPRGTSRRRRAPGLRRSPSALT